MNNVPSVINKLPQINVDSVHDGDISVENLTDEQNPHVNNQEVENSRQNQSNSEPTANIINIKLKTPMNPTLLEYSCWSTHPTATRVGAFIIFTITIIFIGVLIVCLTAKKPNQKCGLKFQKTDKDPIHYNYGVRSVAIGDFNNDTWLDIVVANNIVNNIVVYLGNTHGTFVEQLPYLTGSNSAPSMIAVGDINNDHRLDIAVANFGTNNVGIFLGLENGFFMDQTELTTGTSRPIAICFADFNNDIFLDIATVNYGTHSISVFYGYGNGSFMNSSTYSTGYDSYPSSLTVEDFNNDNHLDLAVSNYGTNNVGVLFGNGNGSFADQVIFSTGFGSRPVSVAAGPFNEDILLDIAVANSGTNQIDILLNTGNGSFISRAIYSIYPASPHSISVADFNRDKRMDLVVTNIGTNNTGIFLGYGNGTFATVTFYSTGSASSISLATADLNKDHRLDVIIVNNDTGAIDILFGQFEGFLNARTYSTGSWPQSIAVGDFNNDTRLDIVVANNRDNTLSVLLGYGDGSFADQITSSTGSYPFSVAVGDFNNDTHLDIIIGNSDTYDGLHLSVFLGYGNGSFANQLMYSTGYHPRSVAVGDFNNDACLDIVVVFSDNSNDNRVSVLLGYGDGSFANQTRYSTGGVPEFVAVGDFNNDDRLDIVVTNEYSNDVSVLLGYGDGSFAYQRRYSTGTYPASIAVSDFNNDAHLDIVVVNTASNDVSVLLGHGDGSFAYQRRYSTGTYPSSVAVGDFNNDTLLDTVVVNPQSFKVSVLLQYTTGALQYNMTIAYGGASRLRDVVAADINNDTNLDFVVANYGTNNIGTLLGDGKGTFEKQMLITTDANSHPSAVTVADFNADSLFDVAVTNYADKTVDILLGNGKGMFVSQIHHGTPSRFSPLVIAHGDFNNDRRSEIAVAYDDSDNVDILVSYDIGSFGNATAYTTGSFPSSLAVGDFNNDARLDIVVANSGYDNDVSIFLGYGNGSFANQIRYSTGAHSVSVAVGDFNNDGQLDIVVANAGTNDVSVLLGYGNGSFANQIRYPTGTYPYSVAVGDFNNDARLDIVVVNSFTNDVSVLLGYGNGSFANQIRYPTGTYPYSVAVGDFNNDGRLDIVVASRGTRDVNILLGHDDGTLLSQVMYSADGYPQFVVVDDFNHDTLLDIVVVIASSDDVRIFLGYGNGSFANQIRYSTGTDATSVAVGDVNNDSHLDIVVTNMGRSDAVVLLGYGNGTFGNQAIYSIGAHPHSVVVDDFNHDNRLDIVVTSSIENSIRIIFGCTSELFVHQTTLIATNGSQPRSFVVADFNSDGKMDVGIAYSGTNNIGIFLGYGNISFTSQQTLSTGSCSSPYSIAAGDFNDDTFIDIVVANSFSDNVGVFLGYGHGTFANQITYSTGSSSSPLSLAIGDFNNDTILDIVVANYGTHNLAVLLGYENGTFASATFISTGYGFYPFSILAGDFNNDRKLDFALANSGTDSLHIFLQTC